MSNLSNDFWLSVYGATIATISLGWNIYNWYARKGNLKIEAHLVVDRGTHTEEATPGTSSRLMRIDVANTGHEILTVTAVGGMTKKKSWFHLFKASPRFVLTNLNPNLPLALSPTQTVSWLTEVPAIETFRKIKKMYAQDSSGKIWLAPPNDIKQINGVLEAMKKLGQKTQ